MPRLIPALVLAGSLGGCMWVASPRCLFDRPEGESLFGLSLLEDRTMIYQPHRTSVWDASFRIEVYSDGYLHYSNGSYPWCRRLSAEEMERIRTALEALRPLAFRHDPVLELARRDDMQAPVAYLLLPEPATGHRPPRGRTLSWSPLMDGPEARARLLDPLLCAVESAMGGGYHYAVNRHFGELLEARGREEACFETD